MHMYYMSLAPDQLIDATDKGNASRFINHSCDPNCEIQKWATGGTYSVGIFAVRDILPGEELTFDYQFERIGNASTPCFCGSPNCRHILGKNKEVPNVNNVGVSHDVNRSFLWQSVCVGTDYFSAIVWWTPSTRSSCRQRSFLMYGVLQGDH